MPAPLSLVARRPWPLWIAFVVFAAFSVLTVPLISSTSRQHATLGHFRTIDELTSHLRELNLHVAPSTNRKEVFLCTRPRTQAELSGLFLEPRKIDRWQGVVMVKQQSVRFTIPDQECAAWGECGMQLGDLYLFGHPELLARIRVALFGG